MSSKDKTKKVARVELPCYDSTIDLYQIEQQGDRHHIDLTAATPAYFNLETGVMPTTGVIFQITLDLLVEFLVSY